MKHLDLFSGIGGFALAASWVWGADHEIVSFCEIEDYPQRVLKKHWPDVPCHDDIKTLKGDSLGVIDLATLGFPCQDISIVNQKHTGINGERSGLWKEGKRVIGETRPSFVVVENTTALLNRGFSDVLSDLATLGYNAEWHCIPAASVGAKHIRDRIWIIAYPSGNGLQGPILNRNSFEKAAREFKGCTPSRASDKVVWERWFAESPLLGKNDEVPFWMDRIKGLGNAIVPQVVVPIMQAIKDIQC